MEQDLLRGQEIFTFFYKYGYSGVIGFALAAIIIGYIIYKTLLIIKENDIDTYEKFLNKIAGKNKRVNKLIVIIIDAFLLIGFNVMVAGFSAYLLQEFSINRYIGGAIGSLICFLTFRKSLSGVVKANEILVPIIIILILILGIIKLNPTEMYIPESTEETSKAIVYSVLYASYNCIALIPMLVSLKEYIKHKKSILKIAFLCFALFSILGIIVFFLLNLINSETIEIPIIHIASQSGVVFKYVYGMVFVIAILTSAMTDGFSFLKNVTKTKKQYRIMNIIMCISCVFVSNIGFSNLVNVLYPILGVFSAIQAILIFLAKPCKRHNLLV